MSDRPFRVLYVVGARPNFVKVAPVVAAGEAWNRADGSAWDRAGGSASVTFEQTLVHTGQHYDAALRTSSSTSSACPSPTSPSAWARGRRPSRPPGCWRPSSPSSSSGGPTWSSSPATSAARWPRRWWPPSSTCRWRTWRPGCAAETGGCPRRSTASSPATARTCCSRPATRATTTSREGIGGAGVVQVGNTMIDTLVRLLPLAREREAGAREHAGVPSGGFVLVTLHRPSNVDDPAQLERLLASLADACGDLPVVFPVHPRTRVAPEGLAAESRPSGLRAVEPLGYLDFVALMDVASVVVTDSGGVQEETSWLGTPCVTVRFTTERPVTCTLGTNRLVHPDDHAGLVSAIRQARERERTPAAIPLWDGHAGERVVAALAAWAAG